VPLLQADAGEAAAYATGSLQHEQHTMALFNYPLFRPGANTPSSKAAAAYPETPMPTALAARFRASAPHRVDLNRTAALALALVTLI
jgi:hypothetical protein